MTPDLETPKMLVLSTAHIQSSTNAMFEMGTDDVPLFYEKGDVGWLIPIIGDEPFPHTCPQDLLAIRRVAEAAGCAWIMLDCDGPFIKGLQTWEW